MLILLCHWGLVFLLYALLFGTGKTKFPPYDPIKLSSRIRYAVWWGMFYGFYFALAISIGFIVELLAGSYCGHVATGIGFFATAIRAQKVQNPS